MEFIKGPARKGLRFMVKTLPLRGRQRLVDLVGPWIAPPIGEPLALNGMFLVLNHQVRQHRMIYYGLYEEGMMNFLSLHVRPGDVVMDPGANVGYVTAYCLGLVGPGGHVHSFEPSPSANAHIRQSNKMGGHVNWTLWDLALTDHEGTGTFYDTPRVMRVGYACLATAATPKDGIPFEVKLTTVDKFCAEQGIQRVRFLKLDIEGSELRALKGAARMLAGNAIDIIMVETATYGTARPIAEKINTLLKDAGFRSHSMRRNGTLRPLDVMAMAPCRKDVIWMRKDL